MYWMELVQTCALKKKHKQSESTLIGVLNASCVWDMCLYVISTFFFFSIFLHDTRSTNILTCLTNIPFSGISPEWSTQAEEMRDWHNGETM